MTKSTASSSKPRERILDTASELFYQKGIQNVGVDEIVARSGVAKMTLYKHFQSKDLLIVEFLRRRDENWRCWLEVTVERYATTPTERLLAIFDVLEEWFKSPDFRGCAFINAAVELANPEHPAHQTVVEHKQLVYAYILKLAQDAKVNNPKSLSRHLMLLIEGAIVTALIENSAEAAQQARLAALALLGVQFK